MGRFKSVLVEGRQSQSQDGSDLDALNVVGCGQGQWKARGEAAYWSWVSERSEDGQKAGGLTEVR